MRPIFYSLYPILLCTATLFAQTASDLNEGVRLTHDPVEDDFTFSWWGRSGRTYFIQQSEDLSIWNYVPVIESGAEDVIQWGFSTSADRLFLRLKFTDEPATDPLAADFDGDGVSNHDELLQGTDPFGNSDNDLNGLFDDWEIFYFGNTGQDAFADPDGDGFTTSFEAALNTDPTTADIGLLNAGLEEEISGDPHTSWQNGEVNLYHKDQVPGWSAHIGEYIEIWSDAEGNFFELQADEGSHGIAQTFKGVSAVPALYVLRYKGRHPSAGTEFDNDFTLQVKGADSVEVDGVWVGGTGDPVTVTETFDEDADTPANRWTNWQYATLKITAPDSETDLSEMTLTLAPVRTTDASGGDITHGGFVDLMPVQLKEHAPESGFDGFVRLEPEDRLPRPWLMVPGDDDRPNKCELHGLGGAEVLLETTNGLVFVTPQQTGAADPVVMEFQGTGDDDDAYFNLAEVARALDFATYPKLRLKVAVWAVTLVNDDVDNQLVEMNEGLPDTTCIQPKGGSGALHSTPVPDDDYGPDSTIHTGDNGICDTQFNSEHEDEVIPKDQGKPDVTIILPGLNGKRNTPIAELDALDGESITTGVDGIRQTAPPVARAAPSHVPTKEPLEEYLNTVFGNQLNVFFDVLAVTEVDASYDVGDPNSLCPVKINGLLEYKAGEALAEEAILTAAPRFDGTADINIYLVPGDHLVHLGTDPDDPSKLVKTKGHALKRGLDDRLQIPIVSTGWASSPEDVMYVIAHEIGHSGNLHHHREQKVWMEDGQVKEAYIPGLGRPLLKDIFIDKLRLMLGGGTSIREDTERHGALLIKEEWDLFRMTWKDLVNE